MLLVIFVVIVFVGCLASYTKCLVSYIRRYRFMSIDLKVGHDVWYVPFDKRHSNPNGCFVKVTWVVLNRTKHPSYPSTPCAVIKQPQKFSWWAGKTTG